LPVITPPPARIVDATLAAGMVCTFQCHRCNCILLYLDHASGSRTWVKCLRCKLWYCLIVHKVDSLPDASLK
jgi:hypothetical protein